MFENLGVVIQSNPVPVKVGDSFKVGDNLIDMKSKISFMVLPFQWPTKQFTDQGSLEVVQDNKAGGSGNEIHCNNANLGTVVPKDKVAKSVTFKFYEKGGNINLIVNGHLCNFKDFSSISPMPPGTKITVDTKGPYSGTVTIIGKLDSFNGPFPNQYELPDKLYLLIVGGQELWIDDFEIQ